MSKKQMVWHAYHAGSLCQYVDLEARRAEIEQIKPENELPTRRRLMKPVIGQLPKEFVTACKVVEAAREAWKAAREAAQRAWYAYDASWESRETSREAAREAWKAAREARKAAYTKYKTEIERLHAIECPDCPWDGETIFSAE